MEMWAGQVPQKGKQETPTRDDWNVLCARVLDNGNATTGSLCVYKDIQGKSRFTSDTRQTKKIEIVSLV